MQVAYKREGIEEIVLKSIKKLLGKSLTIRKEGSANEFSKTNSSSIQSTRLERSYA